MLCQLSYCPRNPLLIAHRSSLKLEALRQHARGFPISNQHLAISNYFVSLCDVCFRQKRQNLLNSSRSVVFFLFFVEL